MRFASLILSTIFATSALAGELTLNTSSCKVQNQIVKDKETREVFSCPCNGGSGDYDWHFSQLPEGWRAQRDKIFAGEGKFENKKVYGAKVEVFDKKNKDSVKRSLFFTFNEGRIHKIVDNDFEFDVGSIVSKIKDRNPNLGGIAGLQAKVDLNKQRLERVFQDAQGVGGGCRIGRLRPFFVDSGLYSGDDKNPFKDKLPNDDEVEKIVNKGGSKQVRDVVVNVVRSKAPCRDINVFLQKTLQKLRKRISKAKDEFETSKKTLWIIQEKIKFLENQLKEADKNKTTIQAQLAEIQKLKAEGNRVQEERRKIEQSSKTLDKQYCDLEKELASLVVKNREVQEKENLRVKQISQLNLAIQELEQKVKIIKDQRNAIIKAGQEDRKLISQTQASISTTKQKLATIKRSIQENQGKIKKLRIQLSTIDEKIVEIEKLLKKSSNKDKAQDLKSQIKQLQKKLDEGSSKLKDIEPIFKDLSKDYEDFSKVADSSFNICFKNLFNEDNIDFKEIDDDRVEFRKGEFIKYTKKLFGRSSNIRETSKPEDKQSQENQKSKEKEEKVEIRRSNIFCKDWSRTHGNPLDDDKGQQGGKKFDQDDFQCDSRNQLNLKSFKGRIVSIKKNIVVLQNENNEECKLFLGGCSRIQTVNKKLPFVGGEVFWRGSQRTGKVRQFNAHHLLCI